MSTFSPSNSPQVSIVAPLYNEADALPHLLERLDAVLSKQTLAVEIVLIDDGSRDDTAAIIREKALSDPRYHCLILSRNFGHQVAVSAGMAWARGTEALFIIDGDLQDPPEMLGQFYGRLKEGFDVVYGVRRARKEGLAKTSAYAAFYRILQSLAHIDIPLDSGDFCMISRRVADVMNRMPEESRFLRGMRAWVGFRQCGFEYEREQRVAGQSKYSFSDLVKLAYNGIFNFSELPIRAITAAGLATTLLGLAFLLYTLARHFVIGDVPVGFTAQTLLIVFFGGINLLCVGVLGEYVLRAFFELKNRPLFLLQEVIADQVIHHSPPNSPPRI